MFDMIFSSDRRSWEP